MGQCPVWDEMRQGHGYINFDSFISQTDGHKDCQDAESSDSGFCAGPRVDLDSAGVTCAGER